MQHPQKITLIGAGLIGSLLSIYLAKRGHKVTMFERRPDLRSNRISAGRSINLALSDRGWRGLAGVGISSDIRNVSIPMKGRMMHSVDGKLNFQNYGREDQAIYSVSRGGLNCVMMDLAEQHGVKIYYNERCTNVDLENAVCYFENTETKAVTEVKSDRVFSTDGFASAGRLQMQLSTDRFTYSQTYLEHGYKELVIPPTASGDFAMDPNALHIWPRESYMLIALPNMDRTFTCTLFFPFEGEHSFSTVDTADKAEAFFSKIFPDALALMPTLKHDWMNNPTSSLAIVRCFPWHYKDKFMLLGDAAHAIVPFYGQGMNCGFEDCVVLEELLNKHGDDWETIFKECELSRKPDGDAIADLALFNFIEMRDKVGKPAFLLQKKIEAWFSERHPDKWIPLYTMVTFSPHIRYSEAWREGQRQERIMEKIMAMPDIEHRWDSESVEQEMLRLVAEMK